MTTRHGKVSSVATLALLREQLANERSARHTAEGYVAQRGVAILELEEAVSVFKGRCLGLEQEVQGLRSNPVVVPRERERMPDERESVAWTLRIGGRDDGTSCTVHVGFYQDGRVGEVFLRFSKLERGTHGAAMADFACTMMSVALQYGAPLDELLSKMIGAADESGGMTRVRVADERGVESWHADPDVPMCRSLRDYLGKKLRARFCQRPVEAPTTTTTEGATNG